MTQWVLFRRMTPGWSGLVEGANASIKCWSAPENGSSLGWCSAASTAPACRDYLNPSCALTPVASAAPFSAVSQTHVCPDPAKPQVTDHREGCPGGC